MALSSPNKVLWSDIANLFSAISTQRVRFGYTSVTPTSYGNQNQLAYPSVIENMRTLIQNMTSNTYAGSVASRYTEITVPTSKTLLTPTSLNKVNDIVTSLSSVCIHDSSFFTSFFTSFNASFNSSFHSSFNSSFNSSFFTSFFSSFNSFDSSFNSSFNFFSPNSFDSGFSSGCFIYNASFFYSSAGFSCSPYKNGM